MQSIITNKQQRKLIMVSALNRLNRMSLANEIGVSEPTLRKVLVSKPPIMVNNRTYFQVNKWLDGQVEEGEP